ncbi:MAG: tripartite tricarboxylate transporter TctB family protein [Candidatus Devosia phytovorans]|uniref:Tripartite tricarboxylate transporter TctB family protein n=1 Tax=Candidatus Devosia phytovorans TaxID=3121372 RepID=A0AAJ6AZM5_9HYPH|nr:tripartite tricarboxylate transporter TctB family protein [Devosia sp.]WEK03996.1 MAG: tripartite tricarboxylate transporter TctB family protein [Devosia sp.]
MSMPDTSEEAVRARADLITACLLVALGVAVVYFSWTMDRLEVRRINPATIPGLVPLFLGIALTICGSLLVLRSWKLSAPGSGALLLQLLFSWTSLRVLVVLGLALVFTLGLMGRMPFWLAAGLFIFAFIVLFETVMADTPKPIVPALLWALGIAAVGGGGTYYVFERIFLVRLP